MIRLIYAFICLWGISVFSQGKTKVVSIKNKPLQEALTIIEEHYGYKFSYIDQTIRDKNVSISLDPKKDKNHIIEELQKNHFLRESTRT